MTQLGEHSKKCQENDSSVGEKTPKHKEKVIPGTQLIYLT